MKVMASYYSIMRKFFAEDVPSFSVVVISIGNFVSEFNDE